MKAEPAFWAVAMAAAQALAGCGGPSRAGLEPVAPDDQSAAGPDASGAGAIAIEEFAERVDPKTLPPTSGRPSRGPADAPVTIRLFSDFECPFCAQAPPLLRRIETEFSSSVRFVWHDFPSAGHPHAERAAIAGDVVYRTRGGAAFWRYHDAAFRAAGGLDDRVIDELALREGITEERLRDALATGAASRVELEVRLGEAAGIEGTPTFVVNEWKITGIVPYAALRAVVARALADRTAERP